MHSSGTAPQALEAVTDSPCETAQWAGASKREQNQPACVQQDLPMELGQQRVTPLLGWASSSLGDLAKPHSPLRLEGCGAREEVASKGGGRRGRKQ